MCFLYPIGILRAAREARRIGWDPATSQSTKLQMRYLWDSMHQFAFKKVNFVVFSSKPFLIIFI
jgi:hypothetical protein